MKPCFLRTWIAVAVLALSGTVPSPARSATLDLTGSDLSVKLWFAPNFVVTTQTPDPVSVSVSAAGGFGVPAGLFVNTTPTGVFTPGTLIPTQLFTGVPLFSSLKLTLSNASQSLGPGGGPGGGFGGTGSLQGSALFGVLGGFVQLEPSLNPVGVGGSTTVQAASLIVLATGGAWTTGVASVTGVSFFSSGGLLLNSATLAGGDARTAGHAGTIRLVAPMRMLSNAGANVPLFFTQTLRFVPEPGTALLFGTGALFAAAWGVRQRGR